jgi:hypothetical protein
MCICGVFGRAPGLFQAWKNGLLRCRIAPQRSGSGVEPSIGDLVSDHWTGPLRSRLSATRRPANCVSKRCLAEPAVAPGSRISMSAPRTRARGDEELSATKGSETEGAGHPRRSKKSNASDRKGGGAGRGGRSGDLGRALRSVYDDTLREAVPDEFVSLIGKLS